MLLAQRSCSQILSDLWSSMKLSLVLLSALLSLSPQARSSPSDCVCELRNAERPFPHDKLTAVETAASRCIKTVTPQKSQEVESLLLGLRRRLPQLEAEVSQLEREDDGGLYGAVSLQVVENELAQILLLVSRLNATTQDYQTLHKDASEQLKELTGDMKELGTYDTMQVVSRQQLNSHLERELEQCKNSHSATAQPPTPVHGDRLVSVTGPQIYTLTEYGTSYAYGAWGRDPKPAAGKESWYWLMPLTASNVYSNYVRRYSSLSALVVGVSSPGSTVISPSNPTTDTPQGPNTVMYGEALYYNCYARAAVCRFDLASKSLSSVPLPEGAGFHSKYNYCHLGACYSYSDLDLATDESGLWVIYATAGNYGNLVLSEVVPGSPPTLGRSWNTTAYKKAVTNAFVARGVLYATRHASAAAEEVFYSFDTATGAERFDVGVRINKMTAGVMSLNYSPLDRALHVYGDAHVVSYQAVFG